MFDRLREQLKLPTYLLAAFCLSVILLAGSFVYAGRPSRFVLSSPQPEHNAPVIAGAVVSPQPAAPVLAPAADSLHVPVLMYHHVGLVADNADALDRDLTVSPSDFQAQVDYFKGKGYTAVTLKQVLAAAEGKGSLPRRPIVFTFDDGWKDVFENAVPILKQEGWIGSFAVATSLLGRPGYAQWDDVAAARDQGMEIISHSENHLDLTSRVYSKEDLERETLGAKRLLEEKLGQPVIAYVYPYGKYDQETVNLVRDAGFRMALTTKYGQYVRKEGLLEIPRVRVHGQDGLEKLRKIFEPKPQNAASPPNPQAPRS
ncbi:MAG: polysaccharide deacetylase family protein [Candidatus Saccharibacteria bacterium]